MEKEGAGQGLPRRGAQTPHCPRRAACDQMKPRESPLGTQQCLHGRHTHVTHMHTSILTGSHVCEHTHQLRARKSKHTCMHAAAHTHTTQAPHTHTLTSWSHGARGRRPEEPRSCCDSDVGKVTSPSTAGPPQESALGKRRKRAVCASPPASGVSCSLHSGGSCPSLVPVHRPDTPQLCNWSLFCHFHPCGITVQLQIPRAHKPESNKPL